MVVYSVLCVDRQGCVCVFVEGGGWWGVAPEPEIPP